MLNQKAKPRLPRCWVSLSFMGADPCRVLFLLGAAEQELAAVDLGQLPSEWRVVPQADFPVWAELLICPA